MKTWIMLSKRFKKTCFAVKPGKLLCLSKPHALTSRYRVVGFFFTAYLSPLFPTPPMAYLTSALGKKNKIRSRAKILPCLMTGPPGATTRGSPLKGY